MIIFYQHSVKKFEVKDSNNFQRWKLQKIKKLSAMTMMLQEKKRNIKRRKKIKNTERNGTVEAEAEAGVPAVVGPPQDQDLHQGVDLLLEAEVEVDLQVPGKVERNLE